MQRMTEAQQLIKLTAMWDNERVKLGKRPGKYGQPRKQYLKGFFAEAANREDVDIYRAIENFMTDPWWSTQGLKFQDLEHFVRNYSQFMPEDSVEGSIYTVQRD